jgi:serine/threonine-protein kinase RsbW
MNKARVEGRSLTLRSDKESVTAVEAAADKLAVESGLDEDDCFRVRIAVHEAAANAVLHGNQNDPEKTITASFENNGGALKIVLTDEGCGFTAESLLDPLAAKNLLHATGRGIFLMRSLMDEVHFRKLHRGFELTLIKHLSIE